MLISLLRSLFRKDASNYSGTATHAATTPLIKPSRSFKNTADTLEKSSISRLIEYSAESMSETLSADTISKIELLAKKFILTENEPTTDLHVFVFHVDMGASGKLVYRDVKIDVGQFDYFSILAMFKECLFKVYPKAKVFLVTNLGSPFIVLGDERTRVIEIDIPASQPMYQRVVSMCAYAHSSAFTRDTIFLDSDAFLNTPLTEYLKADFDIAITVRDDPGLMPVNEGVIIARAERRQSVIKFFDRYLATYDSLLSDKFVTHYYGDIRKWRGGQLSLNAITRGAYPYSEQRRINLDGVRLQCWPCDPFNYSYDHGTNADVADLARKVVIHAKGNRKMDLDFVRAALGIDKTNIKVDKSSEGLISEYKDRRYSLDTTFPEEYFPSAPISFAAASLTDIADHFKTDKGSIKHRYTEIYDKYLDQLRGKSCRLLEIGVACGSSLKTWSAYLGDRSLIIGVDIRSECKFLCTSIPNIQIIIANATEFSSDDVFDVVVDDGSHVSKDIVQTWQNLWRQLRPGGYYIIEDMRCTHDQGYRVNFTFPKAGTDFDRRHVINWLDQQMRAMDYSNSDIGFIHVYRQLVIMQKKV